MPPVNFTMEMDGDTTLKMISSRTPALKEKLLITLLPSDKALTKWTMELTPLSPPTINQINSTPSKLRRTFTMIHKLLNSPPSTMVSTTI
jgi:hypothetical protein